MSTNASGWVGPYLLVDGRPSPLVGVEVHNSSSSTEAAIKKSLDAVHALGARTVLAPVAWDLMEPEEGGYDFSLVDALIAEANSRHLKLIPLWFGTWKNAASTYVPAWVKRDPARFARSELRDGSPSTQISPFSAAARAADARAFSALMRRIREVDVAGTVVAVQVENEIGLLGDSRDRSAAAEAAFASTVPAGVIDAIRTDVAAPVHRDWVEHGRLDEGTWEAVFPQGVRTDEAFMAAAYASYTEAVAAAGRREYSLPIFVNAWLDADSPLDGPIPIAGGKLPGDYPSGGPVMTVASIWRVLAPSVDALALDAYVDDAGPHFAAFAAHNGRLLVPELRADVKGAAQLFLAIGRYRAAIAATFGADALVAGDLEFGVLLDAFTLLEAAASIIRRSPDAPLDAFMLSHEVPDYTIDLSDGTVLHLTSSGHLGDAEPHKVAYGVVIVDGPHSVIIVGRGFDAFVTGTAGSVASFISATMLEPSGDDELAVRQHLNGDETASGTRVPFPFAGQPLGEQRVIPTRAPDSGIVRIETYRY